MAEIISAVYRITNTVTEDFYIGSSKNVKKRWTEHKCKSKWKECPNSQLYHDMQKYGVENFVFEVLEEVEIDKLKEAEQHYIELLKPTYNSCNAKGLNIERRKETQRKAQKKYHKTDKYKEAQKEYYNQLCCFNGQTLTLHALTCRFWRKGISNPTQEAKKYLIKN